MLFRSPSPHPLEIVQIEAVRSAIESGRIAIAGGGGGIPVYRTRQGDLRGVEAVIDKDYTAGLIASCLEADLFVILTGVDQVSVNYGRPDQRSLRRLDTAEARALQADGQFPEGSMGPKMIAAIRFAESTGQEVLITSAGRLLDGVRGRAGTRIGPARVGAPQRASPRRRA